MLYFDKLTGEHNNKKTLLHFCVSWEHIFKTNKSPGPDGIHNKVIYKARVSTVAINIIIHIIK